MRSADPRCCQSSSAPWTSSMRASSRGAAAVIENMAMVDVARAHGGRIILVTGALLVFDAVRGAAKGVIHSVRMVTRKPPRALLGAPYLEVNHIDITNLSAPL